MTRLNRPNYLSLFVFPSGTTPPSWPTDKRAVARRTPWAQASSWPRPRSSRASSPEPSSNCSRGIATKQAEAKARGQMAPEFKVSTQFMELYNEEILDLFDSASCGGKSGKSGGKSGIKIHEDANGNIYTVGTATGMNPQLALMLMQGANLDKFRVLLQLNKEELKRGTKTLKCFYCPYLV